VNADMRKILEEESTAAEARSAAEQAGEARSPPAFRARRQAGNPAQVYSVRIPVARIEQLRRVAAEQGVGPSTLIRSWVIERLDDEVERTTPRPATHVLVRTYGSAGLVNLTHTRAIQKVFLKAHG
jgi:hypothetical protein